MNLAEDMAAMARLVDEAPSDVFVLDDVWLATQQLLVALETAAAAAGPARATKQLE